MDMKPTTYIRACCAVKQISQATLARSINQSPQNLNKKFVKETIRADELFEIAEALGATVKFIDKQTGMPII